MENTNNLQAQPKVMTQQAKNLQLMKRSFDDILQSQQYDVLNTLENSSANTITLAEIGLKFNSYTGISGFLEDIMTLVQNYTNEYSSNEDVKKALYSLGERCFRDEKSIRKCSECFERWTIDANDYFMQVCSKPHLIVFAKASGHNPWPAKVMSISDDDNQVNVEFFGDHTQADVLIKNCILYPRRQSFQGKRKTVFNIAMMEVEDHITEIERKFGIFVPAGPLVQIDPLRFDQQLRNMFPTAYRN